MPRGAVALRNLTRYFLDKLTATSGAWVVLASSVYLLRSTNQGDRQAPSFVQSSFRPYWY